MRAPSYHECYTEAMLIPREEMRFSFNHAKFDLQKKEDREILGWIFNQFLYGEVTGIQCGYWLYRAPDLMSASFLARQASEELSHVKRILRILNLLGEKPAPAHGSIRFLSTGMMGGSWLEHVAIEMALGEGLVLTVFYALMDTIPHPEIERTLYSAVEDEEKHVSFGETETQKALAKNPGDREFILGQAVLQTWALNFLKRFVIRRILRKNPSHPVLNQLDAFFGHVINTFERRMDLLGLSEVSLRQMGLGRKLVLVTKLPFQKLWRKFTRRERLLTETYLRDPWVGGAGS